MNRPIACKAGILLKITGRWIGDHRLPAYPHTRVPMREDPHKPTGSEWRSNGSLGCRRFTLSLGYRGAQLARDTGHFLIRWGYQKLLSGRQGVVGNARRRTRYGLVGCPLVRAIADLLSVRHEHLLRCRRYNDGARFWSRERQRRHFAAYNFAKSSFRQCPKPFSVEDPLSLALLWLGFTSLNTISALLGRRRRRS